MDLYVANATRQNVDFAYRIPEVNGMRMQPIGIGHQVKISAGPGGLNKQQIDAIIEQHRPYGLLEAREVTDKAGFTGLIYSVDRQVRVGDMEYAMQHNMEALLTLGAQIRREAAVATAANLEGVLSERRDLNSSLRQVEMSAVEEEPRGGYRTASPFGEGVRVPGRSTAAAQQGRGGGGRSGRSRR